MANKKTTPLFGSLDDLKAFILWARQNGLTSIEAAGIKATFNPGYGQPDIAAPQTAAQEVEDKRTPEQKALDAQREENELLFWSANN